MRPTAKHELRPAAVAAAGAAFTAGGVALGLPLFGGIIGVLLGAAIPYLADRPEHMAQGAVIAGLGGVVLGGMVAIPCVVIILAVGAVGVGVAAAAGRGAGSGSPPPQEPADGDPPRQDA